MRSRVAKTETALLEATAAGQLKRSFALNQVRLQLATERAGLIFWEWDASRDVLRLPDGWRTMLGLQADSLTLADWLDRMPSDDAAALRAGIDRRLGRGGDFALEFRFALAGGEVRWFASQVRLLRDSADGRVQLVGVSTDVTAVKRAEEIQARLSHSARLAHLGELTASIAHEINQPLSAILSNAEAAQYLLASPTPDMDELRQIMSEIRRDDLRASGVIERVRGLLSRRSVRSAPFDLNATVVEVQRLVAVEAKRRSVRIEASLSEKLPSLSGDCGQIQQVLLNFVLNGMEAMRGTPAAQRELHIATSLPQPGWAELSVRDAGHGISLEHALLLFDTFFTTKATGMGLGLALGRSIAEAHRGRIAAENNPDRGACFRLLLPLDSQ